MYSQILKTITIIFLTSSVLADDIYDMKFTLHGCSKEWPTNIPDEPIIKSSLENGRQVFRISKPEGCGLYVRNPSYSLAENTIIFSYELYANGPIAACLCQYDSEFSFKNLPKTITNATFKLQ